MDINGIVQALLRRIKIVNESLVTGKSNWLVVAMSLGIITWESNQKSLCLRPVRCQISVGGDVVKVAEEVVKVFLKNATALQEKINAWKKHDFT